jgi:LysM repeat protein
MVLRRSQILRSTRSGSLCLAVLTSLLAACSGSGPQKGEESAAASAPAPEAASTAGTAPASAAMETSAVDSSMAAAEPAPQSAPPGPVLAPSAPKSYTVKPGDTLWDISQTFLRDPWYWPEIWQINPQVENPHLIYPGDVLALAYGADGSPQLTLERGGATRLSPRVRSEPLENAIKAIPYEIVASFLSKPVVLAEEQIKDSPYVVSTREQHLVAATGNVIYVRGDLEGDVSSRFNVIHVGDELRDPDDNDLIGYHGVYTGEARLLEQGDPATLELTSSARETLDGDLLFPGNLDIAMDYVPHAPTQKVDGRVISIINGIYMAGQYQVVVINRGTSHGIEPGHVLGIYVTGTEVTDPRSRGVSRVGGFGPDVKLPDWRGGTFMVFKTYDRVSYGLIMESTVPIRALDQVRNP